MSIPSSTEPPGTWDASAFLDRPIRDLLNEIQALRERVGALEAENARLRPTMRPSDQPLPGREPAPAALPPGPPSPASPSEDLVGLLRGLFQGRQDVYAVAWTSKSTGKRGYSPAVLGGWTSPKSEPKTYLPLTDKSPGGSHPGQHRHRRLPPPPRRLMPVSGLRL